jgi:hypothetical protein
VDSETPTKDKLSKKQLRAMYGMTYNQLRVDQSILKLFQKAWEENWTKEVFDAAVEELDWYKENSAATREYLMLSADPDSVDFQQKRGDTYEFVRQTAMTLGVNLSEEQLSELTDQTMMFGWADAGQEFKLQRAMTDMPQNGQYGGDIEANAQSLRILAYNNGVTYNDEWFNSAGVSIATGLSQADTWEQQIREQAASRFPVFAEQIRLGQSVANVASPYVRQMAETLQLNPANIGLDDPTILSALTKYDDAGKPYAMDLGEFGRMLRNDPRWMETDEAQNKITGLAGRVMQMFGIMGG